MHLLRRMNSRISPRLPQTLCVLFAMMASTIPVAIFGAHFMAHVVPVWTSIQFSQYPCQFPVLDSQNDGELPVLLHVWHVVPVMGMLCWNSIKGISVSQNYILQGLE